MKVKRMSQRPLKLPEVKKLTVARKKKRDLSKITTKEFLEHDFENDTDSDVYDSDEKDKNTDDEDSKESDSISDSESSLNPAEHKKSLIKLQDSDPDFYEYLKENDKDLLEFGVSEDEDDEDNGSSVDSDDRQISNVASDDSDSQQEEIDNNCEKITMQLLKVWQQEIQTDQSIVTIKRAAEAFHATLNSIAESDTTTRYKVEGSATFNGVLELCITHLPDAIRRFLKLDSESQEAHKAKRFEKIQEILKLYMSDLVKLLQSIAPSHNAVLTVLLKHLYQMLPYTQSFSSVNKPLLTILLELWSTAKETVRVIAFMNMLHLVTTSKEFILEELLQTMYEKYGQNTKFVSLKALPGINFVRHSLVEIYLLDHNVSYRHAFLHIRQLAIDLRNAVTLKNKENFEAVYNWQYINSLRFWTELITKARNKSMLESLLYPLVQIIIGTIKLNPTVQYYPLRFHCLEMLIIISKETGTFIPILPFLLEILDSYDFNKRHKTATMQPMSLVCILKISKSQLVENSFKDSIIETIYQLILEYAASESYKIYFPDLYISCIIQLKEFLKKCHMTIYCKKIKQLLSVIEENRKYIETERAKGAIDLQNMAKIINWENRIKTDGTAIVKFYDSYIKRRESQNLFAKNEKKFNVSIERKSMKHKLNEQNAEDSEEENEFEFRMKETESEIRAGKRPKKEIKQKNGH